MNVSDIPYPRCLFCGDEIFFVQAGDFGWGFEDCWLSLSSRIGNSPSRCEAFPAPVADQELGHHPSTISVVECLRVIEEVTR